MAKISVEGAKRVLTTAAQRLYVSRMEHLAEAIGGDLRRIDPKHVTLFIQQQRDLPDLLAGKQTDPRAIRVLSRMPDALFLRLLHKHHPKLYAVLCTPEGAAWWARQRSLYRLDRADGKG